MTLDFSAPNYYIVAKWYRRLEDATSIAARFERYLDRLATISPLLTDMFIRVRTVGVPYEMARPNLASLVQKGVERDEKGKIDPEGGFTIASLTRRKSNNFSIRGFVGQDYPSSMNDLNFSTSLCFQPDLSTMTFSFFRDTTLAAIECWEPLYCIMQPSTLQPYMVPRIWYSESWITYVHPSLVHRVSPLDIPIVEATPDGGLLLAATTETFDAANPGHLEAARAIRRATHHLDDVMPHLF